MISEESIEKVKDSADIVDVVGEFITLKKRGVNYLGLCPFHNEKTPSFTVSPAKGIYKCFGCGVSGNTFKFIMEHEHLSFPDTIRFLAKKFNIEIEDSYEAYDASASNARESLYILNKFAKDHFQNNLTNTEEGQSIGMQYFKGRGFSEKVIKDFELGYGMENRSTFTQDAVKVQHDIDTLKKLGLTNTHGNDFFSARVIFPIHNLSGKVIGFGGRTLKSNPKIPKYLNSPESEIYNKSHVLYGLFQAKNHIRQLDECILVEGYTDVLAIAQEEIKNVVASSGTSLTEGQISLIKRYTPNICIIFDGDHAGLKASFRGIDLILTQDMNVSVLPLPEGDDPDTLIKKIGKEGFEKFLKDKKKNFIMFKMQMLISEAKNDPIKLSALVKDILISISKIPDNIKRAVFIKQCSHELKIDEQTLFNELNQILYQKINKKSQTRLPKPIIQNAPPKVSIKSNDLEQEKDIIRVILEHGAKMIDENYSVCEYIYSELEDVTFSHEMHNHIISFFNEKMNDGEKKHINSDHFFQHENKDIAQYCIDLSLIKDDLSENWENRHGIIVLGREDNYITDVYQAVARYQLKRIERLININLSEMKEENDEINITILQKKHIMLNNKRNEIAKFLSTVISPSQHSKK